DEALAQFATTLETQPTFASARLGQGQAARELGRTSESLTAFERASTDAGGRTYVLAHLAFAYAKAGQADRAQAKRRDLQAMSATRYVSPFDLAIVYAGLGERTEMLAQLERAYTDRSA